jgi:hypothetical protein
MTCPRPDTSIPLPPSGPIVSTTQRTGAISVRLVPFVPRVRDVDTRWPR